MRLVPEDIAGKIMFFTTRLEKWAAAGESIGVSEADVAELASLTAAARDAATAQGQAQTAAQSATLARDLAIERMMVKGATMIAGIRLCAKREGDQVYSEASVPRPGEGSPIDVPGMPNDIKADLQSIGWLALRWKCKQPAGAVGTMYQIARQLDGTGPFQFLAVVGRKKFVDDTIPLGTRRVAYEIQAIRSTRKGPIARHDVSFGTDGLFRPSFLPKGQAA